MVRPNAVPTTRPWYTLSSASLPPLRGHKGFEHCERLNLVDSRAPRSKSTLNALLLPSGRLAQSRAGHRILGGQTQVESCLVKGVLLLPLASCVTLGRLLCIAELQFPHMKMGMEW